MLLSVTSSLESPWSVGGVLDGTSPFVSTCCGLSMEGCRGCCRHAEGSVGAFDGGLLGSLGSSLTVDVMKSVSVGEVDTFSAGVFGVGEALALLPSFMF